MAASGESAALSFGAAAQATMAPGAAGELRQDLRLIAEMIEPGSRVLDIGCGDGALLAYLARQKSVDGRGIELSQSGVNACVGHGLSVIQGDADRDLEAYPDGAFDVVVLSQTLQATRQPRRVVEDARAHRPAGDRVVSEFRLLAHPPRPFADRPDAGLALPRPSLVRDPEHPSLHDPRLCRAVRRDRRPRRAQRHAGPPRAALFARSARQPGQSARRAGHLRPLRERRLCSPEIADARSPRSPIPTSRRRGRS